MAKLTDNTSGMAWLKAGIMGPSGSGKSSLGATAPRPLIVLSERQGKDPALARARALGLPEPTIVEVDSLDDYRDLVRSLHADRAKPFRWQTKAGETVVTMDPWPETIVIDSLTDACELVEQSILTEAPPKRGEDGLDVFSQRHWAELKKRCQRLIRALRDVDAHVLFLTLTDERTTETSDGVTTRELGPALPMRKLPDILMQATNVFGLIQRKEVRDETGAVAKDEAGNRRLAVRCTFAAPAWVKVKPSDALNDTEDPDFAAWVAKWRAHVTGGAA